MKKNALLITRVSTDEQKKGLSMDAQDEWHITNVTKENLNPVLHIRDSISGKLFPIKYRDLIIKTAEEKGIDVLQTYSIDRYSRNYAHGAILLEDLHKIKKIEIHTIGRNYDYSNSDDRFWVGMNLLLAEKDLGQRSEHVLRSMNYLLKAGEWPYSPPFGYEKDANNFLRTKVWCADVMNSMCDIFENVKNFVKTAKMIMEKYLQLNLDLTGSKVMRILQNPIYIGYLSYIGELYGKGDTNEPREDLKVLNKEKFDRVQAIIKEVKQRYTRNDDTILEDLVDEYGIGPMWEVLPLKIACRICGSTDRKKNGTDKNGQKKFFCKKCGFENRFPLKRDIKKIEKLVAQPCQQCGITNQFSLINDGSILWQLRCKSCGFVTFLYEYNDDHKVTKIQDTKKEKNEKKITRDSAQSQLAISDGHDYDINVEGEMIAG